MTILQDKIREFNIPTVKSHNSVTDPRQFMTFVRDLVGEEGFVIAWDNGHRAKCKSEDYLRKHKTKDAMSREKNVIEIIVSEKADDLKSFMDPDDLVRFNKFEADFWDGVKHTAYSLCSLRESAGEFAIDRKTYAVEFVQRQDPKLSKFLYQMLQFEPGQTAVTFNMVKDAIANSCSTATKVNDVRWMFGDINWDSQIVEE